MESKGLIMHCTDVRLLFVRLSYKTLMAAGAYRVGFSGCTCLLLIKSLHCFTYGRNDMTNTKHQCFINPLDYKGNSATENKCIGDDTKAAARQSLHCIKNK